MRAGADSPAASAGDRPGYGNSGNLLFAQSVRGWFSSPQNTLDVDGYDPDFAVPEEVNERYDAFLLPLANAFRPQFEGTLRGYTRLIKRLKIPCAVIGVGAQAALDAAAVESGPMDECVKDFAAAVLERSATIGVRGEFTHGYLRRLGFRAVDIIGCPSLYAHGGRFDIRKSSGALDAADPVAVNHSPGVSADLGAFIENVLDTNPNSVLVAQEEAEARRWAAMLPESSSHRVLRFTDTNAWIAFLKTRRFSAGTRIHGNIGALLAGVPAVVAAHDSRTLELARYHEIPFVTADAVDGATRLSDLFEAADFASFNAGAAARVEHYCAFLERNGLSGAFSVPKA
jgi:hypothetical protein